MSGENGQSEAPTVAEKTIPCPYCKTPMVQRGVGEKSVFRCPRFPQCQAELPGPTVFGILKMKQIVLEQQVRITVQQEELRETKRKLRNLKRQVGSAGDETRGQHPAAIGELTPLLLAGRGVISLEQAALDVAESQRKLAEQLQTRRQNVRELRARIARQLRGVREPGDEG